MLRIVSNCLYSTDLHSEAPHGIWADLSHHAGQLLGAPLVNKSSPLANKGICGASSLNLWDIPVPQVTQLSVIGWLSEQCADHRPQLPLSSASVGSSAISAQPSDSPAESFCYHTYLLHIMLFIDHDSWTLVVSSSRLRVAR